MNNECFWHGEEPIPPKCFRVCYECHHAYATSDDLVEEFNRSIDDMNHLADSFTPPITKPEQATFCPLCVHDW